MEAGRDKSRSPGSRRWEIIDLVLRLLAMAATLVAAIVMGRDKQTVRTLIGSIPAKYHYSPANVFFVIANAIACAYAFFAMSNTIANILASRSPAFSKLLRSFFDLVLIMVALLSASAGAAMAVGYVSRKGNSHAFWHEICSLYGRFCDQGVLAIGVSLGATFIFLLLTTFSIYSLYLLISPSSTMSHTLELA